MFKEKGKCYVKKNYSFVLKEDSEERFKTILETYLELYIDHVYLLM